MALFSSLLRIRSVVNTRFATNLTRPFVPALGPVCFASHPLSTASNPPAKEKLAKKKSDDNKPKKKSDDNKPKRPKGVFLRYFQSIRPELVKTNEGMSAPELSKLAGQRYAAASEADLAPFVEADAAERETYSKAMQHYKANKPKRPRNSYAQYVSDTRAEVVSANPNATFTEIGQILGEQWRAMSDTDKAAWKQKAQSYNEKSGVAL